MLSSSSVTKPRITDFTNREGQRLVVHVKREVAA